VRTRRGNTKVREGDEEALCGRAGIALQPMESPCQSSWKSPEGTADGGESPHWSRAKVREGRSGRENIAIY